MKYFEFFKMLEKKDHLINKLPTLTDEQKQEAIKFFTKHPDYESEIDWNNKDLAWEDIEEVMHKERISSTQLKKFVKKDKHFLVLYNDDNCVLFQPLTWLGSRYIASTYVKPKVEGKWCISYQKDRSHWDSYSLTNEKSFIILCTSTTKYALEISPEGTFVPWNATDEKLSLSDFYDEISQEVPNIENLLQKYVTVAENNHPLVESLHKKDLEECDYIEKVKKEEREYRIKIFPKSFKRQVKKKGYYNWDRDITYQDLKSLDLVDEKGKVDERFKYFKISGNLDFKGSPITSIDIPNGVASINGWAFADCSSLKEIKIPTSVTSIGLFAFRDCSSLKSITIPESVTSIGGYAFWKCTALTEINIPNSVTSIGYWAFESCSALESITIPDGITSLGEWAFYDCKSLKSATIGNSVTELGNYAFLGCSSLKNIYIDKEKDSLDLSKAGISNFAKIYWRGEF